MRYEAAYARQSVEKKNSLSIKGQLDLCTQTSGNSSLIMYSDQGYSGKNTDRPDFQRLLKDIKADKVSKLYVYRLDRFSRSIADFGQLWNVLQAHNVEFVSVTENFDTSTPMGRAMLHIIMVFAQLERETTAERVKDNYDSRAFIHQPDGCLCLFKVLYIENCISAASVLRQKNRSTNSYIMQHVTVISQIGNGFDIWHIFLAFLRTFLAHVEFVSSARRHKSCD